MRRHTLGSVPFAGVTLALSLVVASVTSACASTTNGAERPAAGDEEGAEALRVEDVVRLELERASPEAFAGALGDRAPLDVRARGALALARLEQVRAAPLLFRAAQDDAEGVRLHAAFGLGQLDLALRAGRAEHEALRRDVERFLVAWHGREPSAPVRAAVVRALGRVSTSEGLTLLVSLAAQGAERAEALYALGVSGARRAASLSTDAALHTAALAALSDDDVQVRRAAAYAVFRQRLPLPVEVLTRARDEPDAATRVHLARAMQETLSDPAPALLLLDDGDWRVRVEAVRALLAEARRGGALPVDALARAADDAVARWIAKGGVSGDGHVVLTTCDALADPTLPLASKDARPAVLSILGTLSSAPDDVKAKLAVARCRCAVAADALAARPELVRECAPSWSPERLRRLEVEVAAKARISSRERVAWLTRALSDPAVPVRLQAAFALLEDGSVHAARLAAERLAHEEDPAVASALLMLFEGERAGELDDIALVRVVDRFYGEVSLEAREPLRVAAGLLRERSGASASAAAERLRAHPERALRELLDGVPHGERGAGARARVGVPSSAQDLPLAAILHTERGALQLLFDREAAPVAVESFVTLAREGFYDGLPFHRVVSSFVAQGGDPRGDGAGGPGYRIPCENGDQRYVRGAVGVALAGKDTGGSQFFLTHSEQAHLDGRYTLFARVSAGLDVMDALLPGDRVLSVQFAGAVPARGAAR